MITKEELIDLGWNLIGASANGGSLLLSKRINRQTFVLRFHGNNFIYKKDHPEKLKEFEIQAIENFQYKHTTTFKADTIEEFNEKTKDLGE